MRQTIARGYIEMAMTPHSYTHRGFQLLIKVVRVLKIGEIQDDVLVLDLPPVETRCGVICAIKRKNQNIGKARGGGTRRGSTSEDIYIYIYSPDLHESPNGKQME